MLKTFVDHPQRVWARRVLFQIHLWAGILLSLYLIVIGTTGSLLVFEDEFTVLGLPKADRATLPQTQIQLESIIQAAELSAPTAHAFFVSFPQENEPFYRIWMKDGAGHQTVRLADASTGVLHPAGRTWIGWVHDLHVYLLLGPRGLIVNGIGAAMLLLLALTGLVLWWPGLARWTRALWINSRGNWRRINFDLHSAIGFWTLAIVLWWAISGIYFAWPAKIAQLVNTVSAIKGMRPPVLAAKHNVVKMDLTLETIVLEARHATPGGTLSGIALPSSPKDNVIIYVDRKHPGDFSHRDIHYFSAASGKLLATWHYGENQTVGDWVLWAIHPLHFGTLWGLGPKVLWALLGMSLPALSVTGLVMYWNRKLRFLFRSV